MATKTTKPASKRRSRVTATLHRPKPPIQNVASQKHYGGSKGKRAELIDVVADIPAWKMNAMKYVFRAGTKEGVPFEEDIEKARVYIEYGVRLTNGEPISESMRSFINTLMED